MDLDQVDILITELTKLHNVNRTMQTMDTFVAMAGANGNSKEFNKYVQSIAQDGS